MSSYSRAIFQRYGDVSEDFKLYMNIVKDKISFFTDPMPTVNQKYDYLSSVVSRSELSNRLLPIFKILIKRKAYKQLDSIYEDILQLSNESKNIVNVTVTTVNGKVDGLKEILEDKLGKNVKLIEKVDKDLIGGFMLSYGDYFVDLSLNQMLKEIGSDI